MLIPSSRDNSTSIPSESIRFGSQVETSSPSRSTATAVREITEVLKPPLARPAIAIGVEQLATLQKLATTEPVAFAGRLPQEQKPTPTDSFLSNGKVYDTSAPAAPLMPLREKDAKALDALFERDDAEEIEAEINRKLLLIWPEPCWEDDLLDFLREYL